MEESKECNNNIVTDVTFSKNVYQIDLINNDIIYHVFLSVDDKGFIEDHFCSCDDDASICTHQLAAHDYITKNGEPFHLTYQQSPWNALARLCANKYGLNAVVDDSFSIGDHFFINVVENEIQNLQNCFFDRHKETDQNSIKFNNLSEKEKKLWREGRPTFDLAYELSYWSDLAKYLFLMHYNEAFKFDLEINTNNFILMFFNSKVEIKVTLSANEVEELIPTFSYFGSGFKTYGDNKDFIKNIYYDSSNEQVIVQYDQKLLDVYNNIDVIYTYKIGRWTYLSGCGFFKKCKKRALNSELKGASLGKALDDNSDLFKKHLTIHNTSLPIHYNLYFDRQNNLVISPYLLKNKAIQSEDCTFFGGWVFINDNGFFKLQDSYLGHKKIVVKKNKISAFIDQHRFWLNKYPGFNVHQSHIDRNLTYNFNGKELSFILQKENNCKETVDLGKWYYIIGNGFYSKNNPQNNIKIYAGLVVKNKHIAEFIAANEEVLYQVKNFFVKYDDSAIKSSLTIHRENDDIVVTPIYEINGYTITNKDVYDNYIFIHKKGFLKIPADNLLPEKYRSRTVINNHNILYFINHELEQLKKYISNSSLSLKMPQKITLKIDSASICEDVKQWQCQLNYTSEYGTVPVYNLWQDIQADKTISFSPAGIINIDNPYFNWLHNLTAENFVKEHLIIKGIQLMKILAEECDLDDDFWKNILFKDNPYSISGLKSNLRQYQKDGLDWLWQLYNYGLSGLLCDDMGLGKTHQAMALMAAILNISKHNRFLIVCPTSVLYHWKYKIKEFLPSLHTTLYHGGNRDITNFKDGALLTSYGILRKEYSRLKDHNFNLTVLDEIQMAKNSDSQLHKALRIIKSQMILGLTGTPIENNLSELHALFEIILPGYMPKKSEYKELYIKPIEKQNNSDSKISLKKLIKPFILRRLKTEVLEDLPEKTESFEYCDMASDQRKLYYDTLYSCRKNILYQLADDKAKIPYIHIFSLLSHLKQICNHPALFLKKITDYKEYKSGKWELFKSILHQSIESGQKVVIFSHYLGMLDIIENYLKDLNIHYAAIRGSTQNRHQQIFKFNNNHQCEVFVGSLQAVGLGIDLTSASVVIHYDRWWSAAKENQATDRVHRIGQKRGVQVFKLITKNSFEERIHDLILKKEQLMEDIFDANDQNQLHRFDRSTLIELFKNI